MNFHKTLGVQTNADEREIKRAYAKLIKEFRPDTHPGEFSNIREAYELAIEDVKRRSTYECERLKQNSDNDDVLNKSPAHLYKDHPFINPVYNDSSSPTPDSILHSISKNLTHDYVIRLEVLSISQDELAAESLTIKVLNDLNDSTLDEQTDFAENILFWYLNSQSPLLLSFSLLNIRFNWTRDLFIVAAQYGNHAAKRLDSLQQLAYMKNILDQESQQDYSSSILAKFNCLVMTSERFVKRNHLSLFWQTLCLQQGYQDLERSVIKLKSDRWVVLWADLILGTMFGFLTVNYWWPETAINSFLKWGAIFVVTIVLKKILEPLLISAFNKLNNSFKYMDHKSGLYKQFFEKITKKYDWMKWVLVGLVTVALISVIIAGENTSGVFQNISLGIFYLIVLTVVPIAALSLIIYLLLGLFVISLGILVFSTALPYRLSQGAEKYILRIWKTGTHIFFGTLEYSKKLGLKLGSHSGR